MRLSNDFYSADAVTLAPKLLGKTIIRRYNDNRTEKFIITETEAYYGEDDLACHASKGRTKRTEVMYHEGGKIYVYIIYGIYWMLNIVCGPEDHPQAVLIRGLKDISGPGRVGKALKLDKTFYGENLNSSDRIWISGNTNEQPSYQCLKRIGIDYAGETWKNKKWRFKIKTNRK
jgi:DNA-3-methyladenine glycosylase